MSHRGERILIAFTPVAEHTPGAIFELLSRSYDGTVRAEPGGWAGEKDKWLEYDRDVFENPETVGACLFVTCLDNEPIGFGSWDPRQGPELAIIGHNCILPERQGKGYGKEQIEEILRRLKAGGLRKALATTSEHPFFEPARRMYLACGFREARRRPGGPDPRYEVIDYEIMLEQRGSGE